MGIVTWERNRLSEDPPPLQVMIWDDHQNRCIGELSFRSEVTLTFLLTAALRILNRLPFIPYPSANKVKAVKLRRDRVVVVLLNKVLTFLGSLLLVRT
jgi:hypothetical protein